MSEPSKTGKSYRFGPLEQRGIIGGFRRGQVLCIARACVGGVAVVNVWSTTGGFLSALLLIVCGSGLAVVPISGRTIEEWAPVVVAWSIGSLTGTRRFRSPAPLSGTTATLDGTNARRATQLPS